MLRKGLIITFCILILSVSVTFGYRILKDIRQRDRYNSTIVIDSNVYKDDIDGLTFHYLICKKWDYPLKLDCDLYQSKHDNKTITNEYYCNFTLTGSDNSAFDHDIQIESITYSFYRGVIVKWIEMHNDIVLNANYRILRNESCISQELSLPINMTRNNPLYLNDLAVYDTYSDVNIYISSKLICSGYDKCVIEYNTENNQIRAVRFLHFDLTHVTIAQDSKESYYVRGFDPIAKDYKVLGINDAEQNMFTLLSIDPKSEFVSSTADHKLGSTFCYVKNRTNKTTTVNCLHFIHGNMIWTNSVFEIPAAVKLIETRPIHQSQNNSMLLLAEKIGCKGDECWNLIVVVDEMYKPVESRQLKFDCNGSRKNLALYNMETIFNEKSELYYGCEKLVYGNESRSYFQIKKVGLEYVDLFSDKCKNKPRSCISY